MNNIKIKKGDVILIIALLLLSLVIWLCITNLSKDGERVVIEQDGNVIASLNIDDNAVRNIYSDGILTNTVTVKDGKAYMSYADCKDKICKNHTPISKSGESIICLPNKRSVSVVGDDNSVDGVAR